MHHIIVTTLIESEYRRMDDVQDRHAINNRSAYVADWFLALVDRVSATWQANRVSEPTATRLESCGCACHATHS